MTEADWYAILGVGRGASTAQIARAFRKAAFQWHPDRNANRPELAHQRFLLVHQAYEVLTDPLRRATYDARKEPRPEPESVPARRPPARKAPDPKPQRPAAPFAPPPPPRAAKGAAVISRAAWLVLSFVIRAVGFVALLIVGPFAEKRTHSEFDRTAPAFVDVIFPLGRIALLAAAILAVAWGMRPDAISPKPAIVLGIAGAIVFVIERIALASFWAVSRGKPPRK